jgi:hypothetical protein
MANLGGLDKPIECCGPYPLLDTREVLVVAFPATVDLQTDASGSKHSPKGIKSVGVEDD